MGRYTGPKCRQCRREGEKLYLKGERCFSDSCPLSNKSYPPGERGSGRRRRPSQYQIHLREKQKARRIYGVGERQFRRYVEEAKGKKGITGDVLLTSLESRLDNLVYRAGFASSRAQARQLVAHGHFAVNGRAVGIPSFMAKEGDLVSVKEGRRDRVRDILEANKEREIPSWFERDQEKMAFQLISSPNLEETGHTVAANLIVEYYSR